VLAVGVAIGAALYTFPAATPSTADAPACRNAQVHRTRFLATTVDRGANIRSGPSQDSEQIGRPPGGCSVGFVGYRIGTAEPDYVYKVLDSRWLILPADRGFVAAAVVQGQRPERDLAPGDCEGGRQLPGRPALTVDAADSEGMLRATVTSPGAHTVGFALYQPVSSGRDAIFQPLDLDSTPGDGFTLAYNAAQAAGPLPLTTGEVDLVAAPCLAAGIPMPTESTEGLAITRLESGADRLLRPAAGSPHWPRQCRPPDGGGTACTLPPPTPLTLSRCQRRSEPLDAFPQVREVRIRCSCVHLVVLFEPAGQPPVSTRQPAAIAARVDGIRTRPRRAGWAQRPSFARVGGCPRPARAHWSRISQQGDNRVSTKPGT